MSELKEENIFVIGMSCAACAARVEKALSECSGVKEASVNYASATARVVFDPSCCSIADMVASVRHAGYDIAERSEADVIEKRQKDDYYRLRRSTIFASLLAFPVMIIGMFAMNMPYANLVMLLLSTPVVFWFGRCFFVGAWKQLMHKSANMDTLVALSTSIAWLFSVANMFFPQWWLAHGIHPHVYFEASAVIIAFILLGRCMESRAKSNTSASIRKLMGLKPSVVTLVAPDGSTFVADIASVSPGDQLMVKAGERVAVDGIVEDGESFVDESMLSGEPIPVEKRKGSSVYAGTVNGQGVLFYRALHTADDTLLAKIISLVSEAQGSKPPVQRLVDRIAAIFVPAVISIAAVAFVVWLLAGGESAFSHAILAAVTVLIIACPCALGLATPTAIMVGIGKGAEMGILIRDAQALESGRKIDTIVLDKTGTLTDGRPAVVNMIRFSDETSCDQIFLALEKRSGHPLAEAVADYFSELPAIELNGFEDVAGRGVRGYVGGEEYFAGSLRFLEEHDIYPSDKIKEEAQRLAGDGHSLVWFASHRCVLSIAAISDPVKPSSAEAVRQFREMGVEVYMLTGDNRSTASAIARSVGITRYEAEILPEGKAEFIARLQREGKQVAMAGDGINDSAALASADLSIAMGSGSDIAMDVAQITIISSDLLRIPEVLRLARATVRTIRQNLFWAFIYNLIGIPVAAGILYPVCGFLLNPMIAGAAMAFSSVSVVTNSLLLRRKRFSSLPSGESIHTIIQKNTESMEQKFKVEGMACSHCSSRVESVLASLPGVEVAHVDLTTGIATVKGNVDSSTVIAAVENAGYKCMPEE